MKRVTRPAKIKTVTQSYIVSMFRYMASFAPAIGEGPRASSGIARSRRSLRTAFTTLALFVAACNPDDSYEGQVIATVDGEEITRAELNHEARTRSLPLGQDVALRKTIVAELIDRKLLAKAAREQRLDQTPDYLLTVRRLNELSLAQRLLATAAEESANVSPAEVQSYIADNPNAFGQRTLFSVDRLVLPAKLDAGVAKALQNAPDSGRMQDIAESADLKPTWKKETWDSATLPAAFVAKLVSIQPAQTFMLSGPQGSVAGVLQSVTPAPVPATQQEQFARNMIEQSRREALLAKLLARLRSEAEIDYVETE